MSVTPEILKQVKAIELRTRGLVGTLFAGEYRSVFRGQGMEFAEVRAYEAGDDFRSIDWNVSARLASPYVKTFTEERELTLMLLVDQSGSTRFGEPVTKAALAVEVAAVLALAAAYHNDRVGALLFSDQVERVIPPRKGRRHALRVIRDLVAFEPVGRRTNLAASLSYASRLLRHHSIVVVLSDFIADGWERPLRRLAARHEVVAITVDDPREHELPDAGWIEMLDAETRPPRAGGHRQPRRAHAGDRPGGAAPAGAQPDADLGGRGRGGPGDRPRVRACRSAVPSPAAPGGFTGDDRAPAAVGPADRGGHRLGDAHRDAARRTDRPRRRLGRRGSGGAARAGQGRAPRRLGRHLLPARGLARRVRTPCRCPGLWCSRPTARWTHWPPSRSRFGWRACCRAPRRIRPCIRSRARSSSRGA